MINLTSEMQNLMISCIAREIAIVSSQERVDEKLLENLILCLIYISKENTLPFS